MDINYVVVGKFYSSKYALNCKTTTDDVILTNGQLIHIADKHPEVLKYFKKIKQILNDPDMILKEIKMIDTIWLIKEFDNNVKVTIKLNTIKHGKSDYKNSIIQMQYLDTERILKYLKSNRVLKVFAKEKVI